MMPLARGSSSARLQCAGECAHTRCCCRCCSLTPRPASQVLAATEDLKTSACCTAGSPPPLIRAALAKVGRRVLMAVVALAWLLMRRGVATEQAMGMQAASHPCPNQCTEPCCTVSLSPQVPDEVKAKYYGCGSPLPTGIEGLR